MEPQPDAEKARKTMYARVIWFLVGAVINYLLISIPFKYLKTRYGLSDLATSACSMAVAATPFFIFNYFVGFRTQMGKRDAFRRYLTAVVVLWAMSSTLLTLFKHYNAHLSLHVGSYPLDLDVIATQACFGWLKFIIYHKWAFPVAKTPVAEAL